MGDPGGGPGPGRDDEPTLVDHTTSASGVRARWSRKVGERDAEVRHSALVGFMSVPVHPSFPIRRSTLVMAVAFVGLGVLLYLNPAQATATVTVRGPDGSVYQIPGAVLTSPATTTTTTAPPTSTTTPRIPAVTTTTGPVVPSTTPTTAARGSATTTTSSPGGGTGGTGGAAGSTTTTAGAQVGATGGGSTTTVP